MKRLAGASATALFVAFAAGCAGEQEPLIILNSVAPTVDQMADSCIFDAQGDVFISRGLLDVAAGTPYVLGPVLLNNLQARGAANTNSQVEDSELQLTGEVDVKLVLPSEIEDAMGPGSDGEPLPLSYTLATASDSLGPGESAAIPIPVIPAEYATALAAAVPPGDLVESRVELIYHATRTGNSRGNIGEIDSRVYTFPIGLCSGCMIVNCDCSSGSCEPGTESFATQCGRAQDQAGSLDPSDCSAGVGAVGSSSGDDGAESTTLPPSPGTGQPTDG